MSSKWLSEPPPRTCRRRRRNGRARSAPPRSGGNCASTARRRCGRRPAVWPCVSTAPTASSIGSVPAHLVAGFLGDRVVAHLHAEAIGDGPGDDTVRHKMPPGQMDVQVAALRHAVEEGAQRRRVGARVGERCGGDGGVPVAGEPGGGDEDNGEAAERRQHAGAPPAGAAFEFAICRPRSRPECRAA